MPDPDDREHECNDDCGHMEMRVVSVEQVEALLAEPWELLMRDDDPFCGIIAHMKEGIVLVAMIPSKITGRYIVAAHNGSLKRRVDHDTGAYL